MKNIVYKTLTTPYIDEMNTSVPWDIYPRPQFVRDSYFTLNGTWDLEISDKDIVPSSYSGKILVPFSPESLLSGVNRSIPRSSFICYRRFFTLPEGFVKDRVILHFGAVDQECRVLINGNEVGKNRGGYIPFSFDITDQINNADNEIIVIAKDSLDKKYPYGKQKIKRGGMWYTPVSGIWQSVWIESLPKDPIISITIDQNAKNAKIKVNSAAETKKITLHCDGSIYEFTSDEVVIEPRDARLWSPEDPYLYRFTLETDNDRIESYFALRSFEIKKIGAYERMCLNGKPYFFSGLLDQGYYPDGIFLPPTEKGYADDIITAKKLGFNMLRKHIKIEPLIFYYLCDTLGMIVFQDMVNNSDYSFIIDTALPTLGFKNLNTSRRHADDETRTNFLTQMKDTAALLYNTPSVALYTIFNEGWGQFLPDEAYDILKAIDSSRFIDSTSGWFYGTKSDFDSRHIYFKAPSIKRPTGKAVYLSEFGGFSLRIKDHLFGSRNYGYSLYDNSEDLTEAIYDLYTEGVVPLIEDGLCATVYTQLCDVEDETNGLITYDRRVIKVDVDTMNKSNAAIYSEFEKAINDSAEEK